MPLEHAVVAELKVVLQTAGVDTKAAPRHIPCVGVQLGDVHGARKERRVEQRRAAAVQLRVVDVIGALLAHAADVRPQREAVHPVQLGREKLGGVAPAQPDRLDEPPRHREERAVRSGRPRALLRGGGGQRHVRAPRLADAHGVLVDLAREGGGERVVDHAHSGGSGGAEVNDASAVPAVVDQLGLVPMRGGGVLERGRHRGGRGGGEGCPRRWRGGGG
mmetsp:Transcript_16435/g.41448  ORF Transcript_16435/g.41448 Transcript_16435/m.41448 type:complete len:219 (+) Transcript_16435:713-1369(+)